MTEQSPFHEGELAFQTELGVKDRIAPFARRAIRDHMPDQHREFYGQLPFVALGSADSNGDVWATLLGKAPGFMTSPDATTLEIDATPHPDDPIQPALKAGSAIGLLGLEFASRRRNRMSAVVADSTTSITLKVRQTFGNCPQYIQTRSFKAVPSAAPKPGEHMSVLDDKARALIEGADTFFVASYAPGDAVHHGADVSHRGGKPGFVKIGDDGSLTVPDYLGNFLFNTLGNFRVYPRAGLTFVDFETGDLLMLTGRAEILAEDDPVVQAFRGAERAWRVYPTKIIRLPAALPIRWAFGEMSPNNRMTGSWEEAKAKVAAEEKRTSWQDYRVVRIEDESTVIRSFYLEPADGSTLLDYKPGQFLTVRTQAADCGKQSVRTYTVSSAPHDPQYRISVKREEDGEVSRCLHDHVRPGDIMEVKAPAGDFYLREDSERPILMLSAGVGITPMMSMLRHTAFEHMRARGGRPITFIHAARSGAERAFLGEARSLANTEGFRYVSVLSAPEKTLAAGKDYNGTGHISREMLQSILPLDDYDVYLCGPAGFMQAMYDLLLSLGIRDSRIYAEAFGPASMTRQPEAGTTAEDELVNEADGALVEFADSHVEQRWEPSEGTLLEFAENHGLAPEFGCRSGACGTCKVKLLAGKVTYRTKPSSEIADDEVLTCCAVPAKDGGDEIVKLAL